MVLMSIKSNGSQQLTKHPLIVIINCVWSTWVQHATNGPRITEKKHIHVYTTSTTQSSVDWIMPVSIISYLIITALFGLFASSSRMPVSIISYLIITALFGLFASSSRMLQHPLGQDLIPYGCSAFHSRGLDCYWCHTAQFWICAASAPFICM